VKGLQSHALRHRDPETALLSPLKGVEALIGQVQDLTKLSRARHILYPTFDA
jgi:hypothetical protein